MSYKDRNLDQPLVLPGCGLRPGHNVLTLSGCDSRVHCAVAQLVVPTSVEHVQAAIERDGTLGFDECRERMLATFGSPARLGLGLGLGSGLGLADNLRQPRQAQLG